MYAREGVDSGSSSSVLFSRAQPISLKRLGAGGKNRLTDVGYSVVSKGQSSSNSSLVNTCTLPPSPTAIVQLCSNSLEQWSSPRAAPTPPNSSTKSANDYDVMRLASISPPTTWQWKRPGDFKAAAAAKEPSLQGGPFKQTTPNDGLSIVPIIQPRDESIGCLAHFPSPTFEQSQDSGSLGRSVQSKVAATPNEREWESGIPSVHSITVSSTEPQIRRRPVLPIAYHHQTPQVLPGSPRFDGLVHDRSPNKAKASREVEQKTPRVRFCLDPVIESHKSSVSLCREMDSDARVNVKPPLPQPLIPVGDCEMKIIMTTAHQVRRRYGNARKILDVAMSSATTGQIDAPCYGSAATSSLGSHCKADQMPTTLSSSDVAAAELVPQTPPNFSYASLCNLKSFQNKKSQKVSTHRQGSSESVSFKGEGVVTVSPAHSNRRSDRAQKSRNPLFSKWTKGWIQRIWAQLCATNDSLNYRSRCHGEAPAPTTHPLSPGSEEIVRVKAESHDQRDDLLAPQGHHDPSCTAPIPRQMFESFRDKVLPLRHPCSSWALSESGQSSIPKDAASNSRRDHFKSMASDYGRKRECKRDTFVFVPDATVDRLNSTAVPVLPPCLVSDGDRTAARAVKDYDVPAVPNLSKPRGIPPSQMTPPLDTPRGSATTSDEDTSRHFIPTWRDNTIQNGSTSLCVAYGPTCRLPYLDFDVSDNQDGTFTLQRISEAQDDAESRSSTGSCPAGAAWSRSETDLHCHYSAYPSQNTSQVFRSRPTPQHQGTNEVLDLDELIEGYKRNHESVVLPVEGSSSANALDIGALRNSLEFQSRQSKSFLACEPDALAPSFTVTDPQEYNRNSRMQSWASHLTAATSLEGDVVWDNRLIDKAENEHIGRLSDDAIFSQTPSERDEDLSCREERNVAKQLYHCSSKGYPFSSLEITNAFEQAKLPAKQFRFPVPPTTNLVPTNGASAVSERSRDVFHVSGSAFCDESNDLCTASIKSAVCTQGKEVETRYFAHPSLPSISSDSSETSRYGFPSIVDANALTTLERQSYIADHTAEPAWPTDGILDRHQGGPPCEARFQHDRYTASDSVRFRSSSVDSEVSNASSVTTGMTDHSSVFLSQLAASKGDDGKQQAPHANSALKVPMPSRPEVHLVQGHRRLKSSIDMLDSAKMDTIGE